MTDSVSCLLSQELRTALGEEDESNKLVVERKKRKTKTKRKTSASVLRDGSFEKAMLKRERSQELEAVYDELGRHALSPEQLLKLREIVRRRKKHKKSRRRLKAVLDRRVDADIDLERDRSLDAEMDIDSKDETGDAVGDFEIDNENRSDAMNAPSAEMQSGKESGIESSGMDKAAMPIESERVRGRADAVVEADDSETSKASSQRGPPVDSFSERCKTFTDGLSDAEDEDIENDIRESMAGRPAKTEIDCHPCTGGYPEHRSSRTLADTIDEDREEKTVYPRDRWNARRKPPAVDAQDKEFHVVDHRRPEKRASSQKPSSVRTSSSDTPLTASTKTFPSTVGSKQSSTEPHRVVLVSRSASVQSARSALPIIGHEQEIMEAIHDHDVVVICGQTGCGKTTQVPQFLFEAGYGHPTFPERCGLIGITQPRRIAATSTAARVAQELNHPLGTLVGYHIRHDRCLSESTAVKFMTDGILLKELQSDFALSVYSALIIDEAHERSLNTDCILGMLSRIVRLRRRLGKPLKVIVMSATIEAGTLLRNPKLFGSPPAIEVPSRQYSVTVHFSKKTEEDYVSAAMKKVMRMHRQLPAGGILVFLTGKREIDRFCFDLHQRLAAIDGRNDVRFSDDVDDASSEEDVEILPGNVEGVVQSEERRCRGAVVLPLYAMLPPHRQSRIFAPVPDGHRLIVVATNIAETSLTIPNVRYVVDAGRAKQKRLCASGDASRFVVDWISKASAVQRSGRAGRTCPGHCYRLYASAQFERFPQHELPEISCVALEEVVLMMRSMGLDRLHRFPFPTAPEESALISAEGKLRSIGAIDEDGVTSLGKRLVEFPIPPRQALMIDAARNMEEGGVEGVTVYAIALAAVMSVESPLLTTKGTTSKAARRQFLSPLSDPIGILNLYCHYRKEPRPMAFCEAYDLHPKLMTEIASLDRQLRRVVLNQLRTHDRNFLLAAPPPPSSETIDRLRTCILMGWCDRLAKKSISAGHKRVTYQTQSTDDDRVTLHSASSVRKSAPEFVVYTHAIQSTEKTVIHSVTKVEADRIHSAAGPLCTVKERLASPATAYDAKRDAVIAWHRVVYGRHRWELPPQPIPCDDADLCARQFAVALLDNRLLSTTLFDALTKPAVYAASIEAKFHKRLGHLLQRLKAEAVFSRRALIQRWSNDDQFLKTELEPWIQPTHRSKFLTSWETAVRAFLSVQKS